MREKRMMRRGCPREIFQIFSSTNIASAAIEKYSLENSITNLNIKSRTHEPNVEDEQHERFHGEVVSFFPFLK